MSIKKTKKVLLYPDPVISWIFKKKTL